MQNETTFSFATHIPRVINNTRVNYLSIVIGSMRLIVRLGVCVGVCISIQHQLTVFDDDFRALHFNWLLQILDVRVVIIAIIVVFLTATNIVVIRFCLC